MFAKCLAQSPACNGTLNALVSGSTVVQSLPARPLQSPLQKTPCGCIILYRHYRRHNFGGLHHWRHQVLADNHLDNLASLAVLGHLRAASTLYSGNHSQVARLVHSLILHLPPLTEGKNSHAGRMRIIPAYLSVSSAPTPLRKQS